jgi:hypothetical protein
MEINVNDSVRVRLTAFGEAVLMRYLLQAFEEAGGSLDPFASPGLKDSYGKAILADHPVLEDGTRSFQFHELMEIFGPVMRFPAQQMPFQKNRIFFARA